MKISVIIPTYNCLENLEKSIQSLREQTLPKEDYEVIISDDGSQVDNKKIVEKYSKKMNIYYLWQKDDGFRPGSARNQGAKIANGNILLFLDSGVVVEKNTLKNHVKSHNKKKNKVVIGYVYGYMSDHLEKTWKMPISHDFTVREIYDNSIEEAIKILKRNRHLDVREGRYRKYGEKINNWPIPFDIFWTCHVSLEKAVFDQLGGFDESFNQWGGEDFELGVRLFQEGVIWEMNRGCTSIHLPHEHELDNDEKITERINNLIIRIAKKHPTPELNHYLDSMADPNITVDVNGYVLRKEQFTVNEDIRSA